MGRTRSCSCSRIWMTRLEFRIKTPAPDLPDSFSLTLYPGSVFFMPLSTNRLYTHEIRASALDPAGRTFEIPLTHNGVVVFSLETNRHYRHKIVLDRSANPVENRWLGITFRTSRTFVRYGDEGPRFEDGTRMTLADDESARELYRLRGCENREVDFVYPRITYTLSESDLKVPIDAEV